MKLNYTLCPRNALFWAAKINILAEEEQID